MESAINGVLCKIGEKSHGQKGTVGIDPIHTALFDCAGGAASQLDATARFTPKAWRVAQCCAFLRAYH